MARSEAGPLAPNVPSAPRAPEGSAQTWTERARVLAVRAGQSDLPTYFVLALFCLFGAWLRLTALNRQSLWFDEADVVVRAQQSLGAVLHTFVRQGENGPLYNLLLHFWTEFLGSNERWVRLPSALAGVASIPVIYLVGARTLGRRVGLLAAGLLAISPYHDWYSQEAKMYAIAVLLTLVSTLCFIEALTRNRRIWWAAYVVATTLGFYFHVTTVLIFVGQCAFFIVTWRRWPGRHKRWLVSVALLTLPYLPIAIWAAKVVLGQAVMWQSKVSLVDIAKITATKFAVNRDTPLIEQRGTWLYGMLALVGLLGVGLLGWGERSADQRWGRRWALLLAVLAALPAVGLYLLTFRQPLFNDRYLIMSLPAYLLLVAAGVRVLERRCWPLALLAMFLLIVYAWAPLRDINRSSQAQKEDWRAAYTTILAHSQPNDLIMIEPGYLITTYDYYAEQFPGVGKLKAGTIPYLTTPGFDTQQMETLVRKQAPGDRVWLVVSPARVDAIDPHHALQQWLATGGKPLYQQVFDGVVIGLYRLPPAGAVVH